MYLADKIRIKDMVARIMISLFLGSMNGALVLWITKDPTAAVMTAFIVGSIVIFNLD